jgi:hypothetical protein
MAEDHLSVPRGKKLAGKGRIGGWRERAELTQEELAVNVEEELTVKLSRDGLIETADVKGTLAVRVRSPEASQCSLQLNDFDGGKFQLQVHPTIARSFLTDHRIALKQADRGFPVDSDVSVLRWRQTNGGEALLPVNVTCWPEALENGCNVNVEYNLNTNVMKHIGNLRICIPLPQGASPEILSVDGLYHYVAMKIKSQI